MAKPPAGRSPGPRTASTGAKAAGVKTTGVKTGTPRKAAAPRTQAPRGPASPGQGLAARAWGGGPSWLAVAIIVLAVLVLLPIAAAVLGDIWALVLGVLIGGFALGRATAR